MNEDQEWDRLAGRIFSRSEVKAPPYLWTRILAAIEAREQQLSAWWRQLRWMSRLATAVAVVVVIAAGTVIYEEYQGQPLDTLLQGTSSSTPATLASYSPERSEAITTAWLVEGGSSWEAN